MKKLRQLIPALLMAALLTGCGGCKTQDQRELDPAGPYAGDTIWYNAHGVIVELGGIYDDVEAVAKRNPAVVQSNPKLKELVAKVQKERDGIAAPDELLANVIRASDAYEKGRSTTNVVALSNALSIGRSFLNEARDILLSLPPPPANTNAP